MTASDNGYCFAYEPSRVFSNKKVQFPNSSHFPSNDQLPHPGIAHVNSEATFARCNSL